MSTKAPELDGLSRAIAGLEAIDKQLTDLAVTRAAEEAVGTPGAMSFDEGRTLVRAAIRALIVAQATPITAPAVAVDEPATTKRRVKIKAESVTAHTAPSPRAEHHGRPAGRAKAPAKAIAGGDVAPPESINVGSLLARLGAAAPGTETPVSAPTPATISTVNATTPSPSQLEATITADDAATRLARLEAEIAGLTEMPLPEIPLVVPAPRLMPPASNGTTTPPDRASESTHDANTDDDVDDDTEIVIINPDVASPRSVPRVFHDPRSSREEEADVEILRPGENRRVPIVTAKADRTAAAAPAKSAPGSRWRLFRGSN